MAVSSMRWPHGRHRETYCRPVAAPFATLSRRSRHMKLQFQPPSPVASRHLQALCALLVLKPAISFQPRLKILPRPTHATTKPILTSLFPAFLTVPEALPIASNPFNFHNCLPTGGFLQTAVSDAPQFGASKAIRLSCGVHPIQH